jgi:alpha-1,3-glucan synthase
MRARSAKQRFPVAQWLEELAVLQSKAINVHQRDASHTLSRFSRSMSPSARGRLIDVSATNTPSRSPVRDRSTESRSSSTGRQRSSSLQRVTSLGVRSGPGHIDASTPERGRRRTPYSATDHRVSDVEEHDDLDLGDSLEHFITHGEHSTESSRDAHRAHPRPVFLSPNPEITLASDESPMSSPESGATQRGDGLLHSPSMFSNEFANISTLSVDSIVGTRKDYNLQKVDPTFNDSTEEYFKVFEKSLSDLNGSNSEHALCIEDYLMKSEKAWFDRFRKAKLGRPTSSTPPPSAFRLSRPVSPRRSFNDANEAGRLSTASSITSGDEDMLRLLGDNYKPPTGIRLLAQRKIGDWPLYSFLLALGQILAANSYQITLLSGSVSQNAEKFYIIAGLYLLTSMLWWLLFRSVKSVYVLSVPFIFYGLAFFLLAFVPFMGSLSSRTWTQNLATGLYATASSSGSLFFALNFGDEGGSTTTAWVFRACAIQGTQQIYVCVLWAWGTYLTRQNAQASATGAGLASSSKIMTAILVPIASLLFFIGFLIFRGLPDYYRQAPGKVPSFYPALFRRKVIVWFFVALIIQNYFLSTLAGRNWSYLWSSNHAAIWQIVLLAVFFFIIVWIAVLAIFARLSKSHSWILPLFAIGLGAPRWAQILWSCSNIGMYVPWAGGPLASALVGRSLWLWLGMLDALQGVGLGMILLQTLTRVHITFTLIAAQCLGSVASMLARATASDKIGPGEVFPDFSGGLFPGLAEPWFWVGLTLQLCICAGFFVFFRKEQLSKP